MVYDKSLLSRIKKLVTAEKYRIRIHAVRHMIEEGFSETNLVEAIKGNSKIIEDYADDSRCTVLGTFHFSEEAASPLHVVCDLLKS